MKDFRDKGRGPRFNRSAPESPQPARPSPRVPAASTNPATAPPPPREYRGAPNRGGAANEREIVYGVEPIRELVAAAPASIRVLYVKSGDERRFAPEIDLVRTGGGRVEFADEAGLERLAGLTARHQGIAALMREYEYASLESILAEKPDPIVLVVGVTDPRNLGALMRSAEAPASPRSCWHAIAPRASRPLRSSRRRARGYILKSRDAAMSRELSSS